MSDEPAIYIDARDHIPMKLCFSTYGTPVEELGGYRLTKYGSAYCRSWVLGGSVIIGIRGTVFGQEGSVNNLLDDAIIAGLHDSDSCELQITADAEKFIQEFIDRDFCEFILAGHSLGGAAAFCLVKQFKQVTRAISFNGAAPASGDSFTGGGIDRSTCYHIVGDIISTHIDETTCDVRRIKLTEENYTNWSDVGYYHSTKRFYQSGRTYTLWTAQQEQNDIIDYVFSQTPTSGLVTVTLGAIASDIHPDRLKEFFCAHPIPGSIKEGDCLNPREPYMEGWPIAVGTLFGGMLGFVLGGTPVLLALGVTGLATGLMAGYNMTQGVGIIDILDSTGLGRAAIGFVGKKAIQYAISSANRKRIK